MQRTLVVPCLGLSLLAGMLIGCSEDKPQGVCVLGASEGCAEGLVCEAVQGAEPACFAPIFIEGTVFDAADDRGIAGATVLALDANGSARTTVVKTEADGGYALPIAVTRTADGKPVKTFVTLRVAALGYQTFPLPPRSALPVQVDTAVTREGELVVENAATDVALVGLPGGATGLGTIVGQVATGAPEVSPGGVLVLAEVGGKAAASAVSDTAGAFTLFNVPAGAVSVAGYRAGLNIAPASVTVAGDLVQDVKLTATVEGLAVVTGSVSLVNAPGGSVTSVLLVVESTFDETTKRGESPAGLRAGDVTGAFSIPDVPPGRYVVLAAFENDGLVRDPDETIGGTGIVRITVAGAAVATGTGFKVTGALAVVSPGAEVMTEVNAVPELVWADDSSEDGYEVRVIDAQGNTVHEDTAVPRVSGGTNVTYSWTGATLTPGMIYQYRAVSWREKKGGSGGRTYISATEDLRGVFQYLP